MTLLNKGFILFIVVNLYFQNIISMEQQLLYADEYRLVFTRFEVPHVDSLIEMVKKIEVYYFPYFVQYIKISVNYGTILALGQLQNLQFDKLTTKERLAYANDIIKAVKLLDENQYLLICNNITELCCRQGQRVQLKYHTCKSMINFQKKQGQFQLKHGPQLFIENLNPHGYKLLNIWKVGIFLLSAIWNYNISDELTKIKPTKDKHNKYHQIKFTVHKRIFTKEQILIQLAKQCLRIQPIQRPNFKKILKTLEEVINVNTGHQYQSVMITHQKYMKQKTENIKKKMLEIKEKVVLSQQIKKKLAAYLKNQTGKTVKKFTQLFRASYYSFSSQMFYKQCQNLQNILVIINVKVQKGSNIICCYSVQPFDLKKLNGVFGNYIYDKTGKSFIYSNFNEQFYKVKEGECAIAVSMNHGPIFGNGDIVIGEGAICNYSRFPKSYAAGKKNILVKNEYFQIKQYDAYKIQFI